MDLTLQEQRIIEKIRATTAEQPSIEHYFVLHVLPLSDGDCLISSHLLPPKSLYGLQRDYYALLQKIKPDTNHQLLYLARFETGLISVFASGDP